MLTTCDKCRRRDYCDNCADKDSCYWMRVIPPEGGGGSLANRSVAHTIRHVKS